MSTNEVFIIVITAVLGSGGVIGLLFWYLRSYIEKKLHEEEQKRDGRQEMRMRRLKIDDELQHAYGRCFFWLHKAITTEQQDNNKELEKAMNKLKEVEDKKKELDREIIAENEQE